MEMITVPKEKYEDLEKESKELERLKEIDFDLVRQFLSSKEDLKKGLFKRLA